MPLIYMGVSPGRLTSCRKHCHDYYELILNTEGEGTAVIGGREYPFTSGTIQIVPPQVVHYKTSAAGFRDIYFYYSGQDSLWKHTSCMPVITRDDPERTVEKLLFMMLSRYVSGKNDQLLESMYRLALSLTAERTAAVKHDAAVEYITKKLGSAFNDPELDITALLKSAGYDKDYMRRRFFKAVGTTPVRYVENLRINHAKQLLSSAKALDLSVGEVAEMCGYYDSRYFSRVFKKNTGVTPGQYAAGKQKGN